MGALTLGQDCVTSVTTQIGTTLERVAEGGTELVSSVRACDWQPLCQSIHMLSCSSMCIVNCCDVWCVVRRTSYRTSRQTHDISYLTYVRSYDKVARSTIFSHQNKFGSIDRTLGGRQPYPAQASLGTVDIIFKPRVSAFQNCPQRYMGHNIARDIALATKLVILWTGISVYTPIPVNNRRIGPGFWWKYNHHDRANLWLGRPVLWYEQTCIHFHIHPNVSYSHLHICEKRLYYYFFWKCFDLL